MSHPTAMVPPMYARANGVAVVGVDGHPVAVEAHVGQGLPALLLTGLPGPSVQDARERVRPAIENSGLGWPQRRVTVNLSPADLRKEGPGFDLPIAAAILAATAQVDPERLGRYALAGELSLRGALVSTPGVLVCAWAARRAGLDGVIVPEANAAEAALVEGLEVVGAPSLAKVVEFLRGEWSPGPAPRVGGSPSEANAADFAEVRGQDEARRALEVAAAGGHNVLMVGPPGGGKTMLARRLPTILPTLASEEALEVTRLHSVAGLLPAGQGLVRARPFRAPHHTVTPAGLLGGGTAPIRPGEVSLAHHGVLFLDEVAELRRDALEGLRQPLEDGRVLIVRASGVVRYPARFTLVAASNPCPCGFDDDPRRACTCPHHRVAAYRQRLSGPLLDRIDIQLRIPRLTRSELMAAGGGEASAAIRDRVEEARERQRHRLAGSPFRCNGEMTGSVARRLSNPTPEAREALGLAVDRYALTGRGFDRAVKVARTVADLGGSESVEVAHVLEALNFRSGIQQGEDVRAG